MKLTIESTEQMTDVPGQQIGSPSTRCRVWKGKTEDGTPCVLFVHLIAVERTEDQAEFEAELKEQLAPGSVVDFRHIL